MKLSNTNYLNSVWQGNDSFHEEIDKYEERRLYRRKTFLLSLLKRRRKRLRLQRKCQRKYCVRSMFQRKEK